MTVRHRSPNLTARQQAEITAAYRAGKPVKVIAYDFGIAQPAVTRVAIKNGARNRHRNCARAVLGPEAEAGVLAMFRGGKDTYTIAACLRVKEPTVVKALARARDRERAPR